MAYGINEFPWTSMHDYDMHEFIEMYKKLVDDYDGLLNRISAMEKVQATYPNKIKEEVATAVSAYESRNTAEMERFKSEIRAAEQTHFNQLKSEMETFTSNSDKAYETFTNYIDKQFKLVTSRMQAKINELTVKLNDVAKASLDRDMELYNKNTNLQKQIEETRSSMADFQVDVNENFVSTDSHILDIEYEINDIKGRMKDNTGTMVNPMTGETQTVANVINDLYYPIIHAHYPQAGEMDSFSPKAGQAEEATVEANKLSTDMRSWYAPIFINPISGKRGTLQEILSPMATSLKQLTNEQIKWTDTEYGDLTGREYGEMKTTGNFMNKDGVTPMGTSYGEKSISYWSMSVPETQTKAPDTYVEFPEDLGVPSSLDIIATYDDGDAEECTYSIQDNQLKITVANPKGRQFSLSINGIFNNKEE